MTSGGDSEIKAAATADPIGQPIGLCLFVVLHFYTFGLYRIYWAYKNFRSFKCPGPSKAGNAVFALCLPFSLFRLQESMEWRAQELGTPVKLRKYLIAITYFADQFGSKYLTLTHNGPKWAPFVCDVLALLPLLAVQLKINQLNRSNKPDLPALKKYSKLQWLLLVSLLITYFAFNLNRLFGH